MTDGSEEKPRQPFKWEILNSFPTHEPTDQDITPLLLKQYQRLTKHRGQEDLGPADKALLGAIEGITEEERTELNGDSGLTDFLIGGRQILLRDLKECTRQTLSEQYLFRRMYEEGSITDSDMEKMYNSAEEIVKAGQEIYSWDVTEENLNRWKNMIFRRALVPAYLTFKDSDLVQQTIRLVINYEKKTKPLPQGAELMEVLIDRWARTDNIELRPGRQYRLGLLAGVLKAQEIFQADKTFHAVESYFTPSIE